MLNPTLNNKRRQVVEEGGCFSTLSPIRNYEEQIITCVTFSLSRLLFLLPSPHPTSDNVRSKSRYNQVECVRMYENNKIGPTTVRVRAAAPTITTATRRHGVVGG